MNIRYMKNKRAQGGGIGTLIIFIAIVLVAAIAAYVLLGTAGTLQSRSLLVGKESTARVSTQLQVESIYGEANTTAAGVSRGMKYLISIIKLSPGSSPIDMEGLMLHYATDDYLISDINTSASYNKTNICGDGMANFAFREISGNGDNLLESGESVEIYYCVEDSDGTAHPTGEGKEFSLSFRPEGGTETEIRAKVPSMITKTYTRLYP